MAHYPISRESTGFYKPFNSLEAGYIKITQYLMLFGAVCLGLLVIPICIDVFLRSFASSSMDGIMEIQMLVLVIIAYSATALTFIKRQPVQIDLFYTKFKAQKQCRIDLFANVMGITAIALLALKSFQAGFHHAGATAVLLIPESYVIFFTAFSFFLVFIAFIFLLLHSIKEMIDAKDYLGIFLAVFAAISIMALPFIYRYIGTRLSGLLIGTFGFALLMVLLLIRVPIAIAMLVIGICGSIAISRNMWAPLNGIGLAPFRHAYEFTLVALPMFMLMGEFIYFSGLSHDLFDCANKWMGRLPGGLAAATIGGCAGFGAVCGESLATVATMSSVALPAMEKEKYHPTLSTGALAAGGTLGILIPPSMGFIFYSIMTEESIGKLFIAGIIPGILLTLIFIGIIIFQVWRNPELAPKSAKYSLAEKLISTVKLIPVAVLFIIVVGGILAGYFTPGEGGAVGAAGGFLFALMRKKLTKENLKISLVKTTVMCGRIFMMIMAVQVFGGFLAASRLPTLLADFIMNVEVNRYVVLGLVVVIYIFLGCIMNIMPMMMLTLPSIYPTIQALGFDGIWFGVVTVIVMEMGMITPPVGMNVFTMSSIATHIPMAQIFRGVMPFFVGMLICAALVIIFPELALWLPNNM